MKVGVGSKNITKIAAVRDAVALYPQLFPDAEVIGVDVQIEEFGHPKNIDETVRGAVDRARQAFSGFDYGFGLEGGLLAVPHSVTGYMETSACAVFDGVDVHLGLAPAFEWPTQVTQMILRGEADASRAFKLLGLTEHEKLGAVEGGITGVLTYGKVPREDFVKYSILMALVRLEQPEIYKKAA